TGNRDGRVVLLRPVHAVGKLVVRDDVIELTGRLILLRGPGATAVPRDCGPTVVAVDHPSWILRRDPEPVVIRMRRAHHLESATAVDRLVDLESGYVHGVRV